MRGRARSVDDVRETIESLAAQHNLQPRTLAAPLRRELIRLLFTTGLLQLRGTASIAANILGISRASIYNALK
jgi:predicted transcriptional regulator YheO